MGTLFLIAAVIGLVAVLVSPEWRKTARRQREKVAETAAEAVRRQIEGPKPSAPDTPAKSEGDTPRQGD